MMNENFYVDECVSENKRSNILNKILATVLVIELLATATVIDLKNMTKKIDESTGDGYKIEEIEPELPTYKVNDIFVVSLKDHKTNEEKFYFLKHAYGYYEVGEVAKNLTERNFASMSSYLQKDDSVCTSCHNEYESVLGDDVTFMIDVSSVDYKDETYYVEGTHQIARIVDGASSYTYFHHTEDDSDGHTVDTEVSYFTGSEDRAIYDEDEILRYEMSINSLSYYFGIDPMVTLTQKELSGLHEELKYDPHTMVAL